jgi:DNA-binding CsgD family transcriptional regulator/tetratricopeptide (TPR) repeat protein
MYLSSAAIVGRDGELGVVAEALAAARGGRGGAVFLTGEGGIGKSRLAEATADLGFAADMSLMRGRASTVGPIVPFRSLTEALLSLVRVGDPLDLTELGPYRSVLARLVPDWSQAPGGAESVSLVVLAEAVLRLTGLAGRDRGCLIILEDLQNADAETLAVVEYLIDNLDRQPTVLLGTVRSDPNPALELTRSAAKRRACRIIHLDRLARGPVRELAASCLAIPAGKVPGALVDLLWAGGAGNPLLTEDLLGGMVDGQLLVRDDDDGWSVTDELRSSVPSTLTRSVAQRVAQLPSGARELLLVAAVLGRRFPLTVVRAVTGLDDRNLLSYLHGGLATHLLGPDDRTPDWYAFQHPLLVEALLGLVGVDEQAELARRAADAVDELYPNLPGEWCQMSATLRLQAGNREAAGRLFAEAGRRALAQGAAHSAVALLDRANDLLLRVAARERADLHESLLHALTEAGLVERALQWVDTLDRHVKVELDSIRRAQWHTHVAWAAVIAGRVADAQAQVDTARTLLGPDPAPRDSAPVDVVAAHVALDSPGQHQIRRAEALARSAAVVAEAEPLPVVSCQAWNLLGALTRLRDPEQATVCLERARAIAVRYELPIWEIHTLVRLGTDEALRDGSLDRLEQARRTAATAGAVTAGYQAEAAIALQYVLRGDFVQAGSLIEQVLAATTRLKLIETTQYLLLVRAANAAHQGGRAEMDRALAEYRAWGGAEALHAPRVCGLIRAFCALLEEDRGAALREQAKALAAERESPTVFHLSGRYGLDLLLRALSGDLDRAEYDAVTAVPASRMRWDRQFALLARAVLDGRAERYEDATRAVAEAGEQAQPYAMSHQLGLRLVGEAAIADGWGTPAQWLRGADEYFHQANIPAVSGACRALLRQAGATVGQRRAGVDEIPSALRVVGVTVREYEVLRLLTQRMTNREVAERLFLSPRTVEKHVANLMTKTGMPDRVALGRLDEVGMPARR